MKLYSYWRSSSAWRVRIVLNVKDVPCEIVPVHLLRNGGDQHSKEFLERNALAQVPVLEWEDGGKHRSLTQSVAICEYLEATRPNPPLLPRDPYAAARCRQIVEIINSGVQPLQNSWLRQYLAKRVTDFSDATWACEVMERGFVAINAVLKQTVGKFAVGNSVTLADVFIVPQLYNARRFGLDLGPHDALRAIDDACAEIPAFQKAHPDRQIDANS